jgi:hypothetical protein
MIDKGLLEGIRFPGPRVLKTFDGGDVFPVTFHGQGHAGQNGNPVHQNRAGTASPLVAPDFRPGEPQGAPEGVGQGVGRRDLMGLFSNGQFPGYSIDMEDNGLRVFLFVGFHEGSCDKGRFRHGPDPLKNGISCLILFWI